MFIGNKNSNKKIKFYLKKNLFNIGTFNAKFKNISSRQVKK